jgi:hypothetical protein
MDRLVWGPDHHSGRQRRYTPNRPGGRSGRVACTAILLIRFSKEYILLHIKTKKLTKRALASEKHLIGE